LGRRRVCKEQGQLFFQAEMFGTAFPFLSGNGSDEDSVLTHFQLCPFADTELFQDIPRHLQSPG
jgi:hypothetical protein